MTNTNITIQSEKHFNIAKKIFKTLPNFFKGTIEEWCKFINSFENEFYLTYHNIDKHLIAVELISDDRDDEEELSGYHVIKTKYIKWTETTNKKKK